MSSESPIGRVITQTVRFWGGASLSNAFGIQEVLIGVAAIAVARATVDLLLWLKIPSYTVWLCTFLLWFFYILSVAISTAFLLTLFFPGSEFKLTLTMAVCLYWVVVPIPAFSLLSWEEAWGLGMFATVPFFRWIPTFLVERNYLPLGMIVVIPVILLKASRFMAQATATKWGRAVLCTLVAFIPIYVYYYQWSQRAMTTAFFDKAFGRWEALLASYVTYAFLSQVITFLLAPRVARSYNGSMRWAYILGAGVPLLILFAAPRVGFFALFLAPSLR